MWSICRDIYLTTFQFFGFSGVIDAWGREDDYYDEDYECWHKYIARPCLVVLGVVNAFDTIVDILTGGLASFNGTDCSNAHPTALILFIMSIVAALLRKIFAPFEVSFSSREGKKDAAYKLLMYVVTETIVFVIEDAASILFLAARPCALNVLERISVILTLISFVPIGFALIRVLFVSGSVISSFMFFIGTFMAYFGFEIYIAIAKVLTSFGERDDGAPLDGTLYNVTFILYWCVVVVLPISAYIALRGNLYRKGYKSKTKSEREEETSGL